MSDYRTSTEADAGTSARRDAEPVDRPNLSDVHSTGIGGYVFPEDAALRFSLWGALVPQDEPPF